MNYFRRALPIDRARHREKGQPLCMEQYYRLFSSYRQPGITKDTLTTIDTTSTGPEHIIVLRNNQVLIRLSPETTNSHFY